MSIWKNERLIFASICAIAAVGILAGCEPKTPEQRQKEIDQRVERNNGRTKLLAIVDGCRIWEVYNEDGTNPFFARCPEGSADTFESHTVKEGKHTKKQTNFTMGDQ